MLDHTGMAIKPIPDEALPLSKATHCLRVPPSWLRGEIESKRLPGLKAGRVTLVHVPTVAALLTDRAKRGEAVARD